MSMLGKLPRTDIGTWAKEIIDECTISRDQRRELIRTWKSFYFTGSADGVQVEYNKCYTHIERLAPYLFSPADVRFMIEFDETEDEDVHARGRAAARHLNREYHRCNIDLTFSAGVTTALVKGKCLNKKIWGHNGLEGWLVHPEMFGVLIESINSLDRQEAFVETTYITKAQLRRTLAGHADQEKIMRTVERQGERSSSEQDAMGDFFHQVLIGGNTPLPVPGTVGATGASGSSGTVGVIGIPQPVIDPKVATGLVRIDELWAIDDERQDYTTVRMVNLDPELVTEGKYKRRNLCGLTDMNGDPPPEMRGHHPYSEICPNEVDGYFWGMSEISQIYKLQNSLNGQLANMNELLGLRSNPPRAFVGFSGMTQEKYKMLKRRGGFASEENPNAKIETLAPEIPEQIFTRLDKTIQMFDDVAGFAPIMQGQSEPGVRAGSHAQTLARNASPRMRDRALLVERQCVEDGDFCLKMEQSKNAEIMVYDAEGQKKGAFLIKQLPDDARVTVDSHTASPAFQEDAERKAFQLARLGAIDHADLIMLTHPPHEDTLVARAKQRAAAQAQFMQQHPEMMKQGPGRKKLSAVG
jgi:hypothetical protein